MMKRRKSICQILIEKPQDDRFLRQIMTMGERGFILRILTSLFNGLTKVLDRNHTLNEVNSKKRLCTLFFEITKCYTL